MAQKMAEPPKSFGTEARAWLDSNFVTSQYRPNYTQGQKIVGELLGIASRAREELERALPHISPKREDVKRVYNIYRTALLRAASLVEDARSQMLELREKFSRERPGELALYDSRIAFMEQRISELYSDAEWLPTQLKGHKFKEVPLQLGMEVASLEPRKNEVPVKVFGKEEAPILSAAEKKGLEMPPAKAGKKHTEEMVFTLLEVERDQEIAKIKFRIRELEEKIKIAKKEGKPLEKLRLQRYDAYLMRYVLTGQEIPRHAQLKRA